MIWGRVYGIVLTTLVKFIVGDDGPQFRRPGGSLEKRPALRDCHICLVRKTFSASSARDLRSSISSFGLQWGMPQNGYLDGKMMEIADKAIGNWVWDVQLLRTRQFTLLCVGLESQLAFV